MQLHNTKARGFTLIELVIVIALIGILAATALPKFADLTSQARTAAADGVAGALGAAVAVAHSQYIADGSPSSITLEGTTVYMSATGWPEDTAAAADGTMTDAKCLAVWNGILSGPPSAAVTSCTGSCQFLAQVNASDATQCEFIDEQGSGSNTITYDINDGSVTRS